MSSIKIIHNNTARRLTVNESTQWSEVADRISALFQLRPLTSIVLSYVDSDNDTITLNTTSELQDALAQGVGKFQAAISSSDASPDDWVLSGTETPRTIESTFESLRVTDSPAPPAPLYTEVTEPAPQPSNVYQTTIEDLESVPLYVEEEERPRSDKGKQKEETGESSRAGAARAQRDSEKDGEFPFHKIQEQLQTLCEQFKDVIEQNPQLLETANALMEQLVQQVPVDIDIFATFLHGARAEAGNPFEFAFRPGPFRPGPFRGGCFRGPGVFVGNNQCGNRAECGRRGDGEQWRARREEWIRARKAAYEERHREAEREVKQKVEWLNSMGFLETYANETMEELIARYNGNVERVVDVLIQRQQAREATGEEVKGYDF